MDLGPHKTRRVERCHQGLKIGSPANFDYRKTIPTIECPACACVKSTEPPPAGIILSASARVRIAVRKRLETDRYPGRLIRVLKVIQQMDLAHAVPFGIPLF